MRRAIFNVRNGEGNWEGKFSIKDVNLANDMLNYVFKQLVKYEEDNAWNARVKGTLNNLEIREMGIQTIMRCR